MDLLEAVESARFAGREFLLWLWFESDLLEGQFEMPDGERFDLWLEQQVTLESVTAEQEVTRMRGAAPTASSEAHEALRRGKLPVQARVRIERGQQSFGFTLNANTMNLASMQLPQLIKSDEEERFYERMYLIEELEKMVDALYERFLEIRLSPEWDTGVLPMMRTWVKNPDTADAFAYRKVRGQVKAWAAGKPAGWLID